MPDEKKRWHIFVDNKWVATYEGYDILHAIVHELPPLAESWTSATPHSSFAVVLDAAISTDDLHSCLPLIPPGV